MGLIFVYCTICISIKYFVAYLYAKFVCLCSKLVKFRCLLHCRSYDFLIMMRQVCNHGVNRLFMIQLHRQICI